MRQFLVLLHSNAILTLGPMLSQIRSIDVQQQLLEIIEIMARRDFKPLEQLLSSNDEHVVQSLVYIASRIPGKKSNQILLKMIHNPSEMVRKQALKHLFAQESVSLEIIFPFIEDSSKTIRQLILDYLKQNKPEKGEALLIEHLQQKRFLLNNHQHIIACYKTLGKCGSSISIPFLQKLLFKRRLLPDFRGPIHRQGAVIALIALETKEAKRLLQKASRSFFPNVRIAYKRGLEAIH
jgi:HEAT repeat protein